MGGPNSSNDNWDEDICPAALDPRLIKEREEMLLRSRDRRPAAASVEALQKPFEENRDNARHREALFPRQEEVETVCLGRILHENTFLRLPFTKFGPTPLTTDSA